MKTIYKGDTRYEKVYEQMQLLGIQDVSTPRQVKNGTIVWRLPILSDRAGRYIEYAAFASGYVRNQGVDCHSNWQINKRCEGEPQYFESRTKTQGGRPLYIKWTTRGCELIPIEIDRLEYMMKYIIKNEFIKRANTVQKGNFVPKWQLDQAKAKIEVAQGYVKEIAPEMPNEVTVIIDGHRYKVI
jgi:hypothetical protein